MRLLCQSRTPLTRSRLRHNSTTSVFSPGGFSSGEGSSPGLWNEHSREPCPATCLTLLLATDLTGSPLFCPSLTPHFLFLSFLLPEQRQPPEPLQRAWGFPKPRQPCQDYISCWTPSQRLPLSNTSSSEPATLNQL